MKQTAYPTFNEELPLPMQQCGLLKYTHQISREYLTLYATVHGSIYEAPLRKIAPVEIVNPVGR